MKGNPQTMKTKVLKSLDIVVIFLLIFFNNETLSNNLCTFVEQPIRFVTAFVVFYGFVRIFIYKRKINSNIVLITALLSVFIVISLLMDRGYTNGYVLLIMGIVNAAVIATCIDYTFFVKYYVLISCGLALISIICTYVLKPILYAIPGVEIVVNSASIPFYNVFVCYVCPYTKYFRNFGIYREPGVYSIFLCLAISMLLFSDKLNFKKSYSVAYFTILVIALISTFSTTGYLSFLLIMFIYIMSRDVKLSTKRTFLVLFVVLILVVVYGVQQGFLSNPFEKFNVNSSSYSSFEYRYETIVKGLQLIILKPFGYGIQNGISALQNSFSLVDYHNTNTWISMAVYIGVPYVIVVGCAFLRFFIQNKNQWLLAAPFILLLSGETLIYNPFVYIIVMYGVSHGFGGWNRELANGRSKKNMSNEERTNESSVGDK